MKTLMLLMMALPFLATVASADPLAIGDNAPDFTLTDLNGKTHKLSEYRGKTVVLEWINPGCPFVVGHYANGNFPKLQKKFTGDGVVWLTINSTRPDHPDHKTADEYKTIYTQWGNAATANLLDAERTVGKLYDAKTTPHMYIIAPDGKIAYQGAIDDDRSKDGGTNAKINYVIQALGELKEGKAISTSNTKPYGCSVKY